MRRQAVEDVKTSAQNKLPADPYKGLTYYGPEDIPLFAGRSSDVRRVARIIGAGSTRVLLLHGSTGCGKSSFLRAALIPFLENQVGRFTFARESGPSADVAMFVRSFHDPLVELASKAWEYAKAGDNDPEPPAESGSRATEEKVSRYAKGPIIDFKKYPTMAKFTAAVADDPERLVELIGRIAYRRPRTQALVVDQAEEVLTLKPGREGDDARRRFFMFLTYLSYSDINFRLIVAFRTEYHGRFYAALQSSGIDAASVEDYYMADLTGHDLLEAITRPTSADEIPGYGVPLEHYRFYYQEGLPEMIARDLEKAPLAGGTLPVLQIVCRRLYQKAISSPKVNGYWVIRQKDYQDLGGIQGQVDLHLQQALEKCCDAVKTFRLVTYKLESMRWRDVLSELAKPQADGTVTNDVKPAKALSETAELRSCRLPFDDAMKFLLKDEWKIVRPVELTRPTGEKVPCYSLGHDVLGGVLESWKDGRRRDYHELRKALIAWGVVFILFSLAMTAPAVVSILKSVGLPQVLLKARFLVLALGGIFLILAAIPDNRRFKFLYQPVYGAFSNLSGLRRLPGEGTQWV